jgi:hypothetical protein
MTNLPFRALIAALLAMFVLAPGMASAAPGNRSSKAGAAQAMVVQPIRIVAVNPLRFGQIARPNTAGTIIMSPLGVITATGGLLPSTAIVQTIARGPGSFNITGDPSRLFRLTLPAGNITLRSGTRTIRMSAMRSNWVSGASRLSTAGTFALSVGATLNIGANQANGTYTGTYAATVVYQ